MKADLRTLDLNLLKTLDALLDERSVTRAAARLALTQPAVSGMLNRLRDYFDDPLFIRAPHGMVTNHARGSAGRSGEAHSRGYRRAASARCL